MKRDWTLASVMQPPIRFRSASVGFLYKQLTDDRLNGAVVGDGNRGQAGIGPFVRYHPSPDWGITFKWQRDVQVENKTEGDRFILQVMYKLR